MTQVLDIDRFELSPGIMYIHECIYLYMLDLWYLPTHIGCQIPSSQRSTRNIPLFFQPDQRPEDNRPQYAEESCEQIDAHDEEVATMGNEKLDKLRGLIQILLFGNIIERLMSVDQVPSVPGVRRKVQHRGQRHGGHMEGYEPDGKYLGQVDV